VNQMPDWILAPIVLLFSAMAIAFLFYPEMIQAKFAQAISRHRISGWLFFKDATRIRFTGLIYLVAVIAMLYWRLKG
jgi:hypothetical protein